MKYGGSYRGGGHSNNSGGAAKGKSGDHYTPLCRASGMSKTMSAVESGTRSQAKGTSKHNRYESPSTGYGDDNVVGYSPE